MLRLKKSALKEDGGRAFYKGDLFSGIAFVMSDGEMVNAIKISEGVEIGEYFPKLLPASDCRVIDIELLLPEDEDDYEPFLCLDGQRFSGIALEFDGDFCTGEILYVRGWSDSKFTYYKTGRLESIELVEDGFSQIYQWYESSQLKKYKVASRSSFSFNLEFKENGCFSVLGMEGDYFNQVKLMSDKLALPAFKDEGFVHDLKSAEFLSLSGYSITDKFLKTLILLGVLERAENISIFHTSVTSEGLSLFKVCRKLSKLNINSTILNLNELKLFKFDKPNCYVELNGEEVLA